MDSSHDISPAAELPSCSGCRKRKLKCSRQTPACSNCERLGAPCIYENRRTKPGLKSGAVESLSQRLEKVEKVLFDQSNDADRQDSARTGTNNGPDNSAPLETILSTLAVELQRLNKNIDPSRISHHDQSIKSTRPRKRQRREISEDPDESSNGDVPKQQPHPAAPRDIDIIHDHLDDLLQAYFHHIQPWIPMINMKGFKERVRQDTDDHMGIVLRAMTLASLRYIQVGGKPLEKHFVRSEALRLRRSVVLYAMEGLTTENLQALIMVAFTDIGDGNLEKAWPIIGCLTRTVEYMELSVEAENYQPRSAVLPNSSLPEPLEWTEEEERRRVFWNVFILDRFSSIVKGWNTIFPSALVRRRLPICGGNWLYNEPAVTPYFGNWGRSEGSSRPEAAKAPSHIRQTSCSGAGDKSKIGAFAYYVESIDILSEVLTGFLHHQVDFGNRQEVSLWLTRFKELDLRLVHWKTYLPQQWKDSGISREIMPGVMDPNMTIANATHNTSLILIHQRIAYPDSELEGITLPSLCSAETCYNAAIETANITAKYLEGSVAARPVSPQLGICAFVSAQVLLGHSLYYKTPLADEFRRLIRNLNVMSNRWVGLEEEQSSQRSNFFDQLSRRLEGLYQEPQGIPRSHDARSNAGLGFSIALAGFRTSALHRSLQGPVAENMPPDLNRNHVQLNSRQGQVDSQSSATSSRDELFSISQTLTNNEFLEMDRIISFEDMMTYGDMSLY
ncbi:hypothetical protein F53441_5003 [Fusarium austroafricanum]|uniref:Zn(2)-C6 fungal-type domain-containing protein n=1 Tax=Fusarium austroafricanum TaxID=2364996 RepID=A0A8H4P8R1_9HYPO|nr:hypothetical protein F53441_5003 [Fusarium austroafricanum]